MRLILINPTPPPFVMSKPFLPLLTAFVLSACATPTPTNPPIKVTPMIKSSHTWDGKAIAYPNGTAEVTGLLIEIAPNAETGWHYHPMPSFELLIEGTLEVTLTDGTKKRIEAGETFFEVVNTAHNGKNIGTVPAKILAFYAGTVNMPVSVKVPLAAPASK